MIHMQRELLLGTVVHRRYAVASIGRARAYWVESDRIVLDSSITAALAPSVVGTRCNIAIPLDGRYSVKRDGHWIELRPGELIREHPQAAERWEGDRFSALVLEWDTGAPVHDRSSGTLSAATLASLREIAGAIRDGRATASTFESLARAVDLPPHVARWMSEHDETDAALQPVASALGAAMSRPNDRPAWADLEAVLARSERHSRRLMSALFEMLDIRTSLRAYLRMKRLAHAAQLLTAPGVSVDEVARSVGYGSSRALGTALEQAGLPRARELRAALLAGG
jgi:methylphosphotriester-DNA--protein-cysteine methyltransferase